MELKFSITNQTLKRVDENKPVEKSQDYLYCYFDFSTNDWEKATNKYAIFSNEEYNDEKGNALAYEIIDNKCLVPNEILNSNELSFKVNVVGTNESGLYILPTSVEYVRLNKTGSLDGMQPSENAPTIYQKLVSGVNASFSDLTYEFNRDSGKLKLNFISNDKSVKSFEVDLPTEELVKNVEYDVDNSQLIIEWENGQTTNIPMSSVVSTPSMIEITYEELKALKDNNELIVGQKYRIIDYETTTIQYETQSANHPFDIIVTATSENTFDENASACARKGDNYFGTWYEEIESATGEFLDNVTPESIEVAYTILVDEFGEASSDKYVGGLKNGSDQIVEIGYAENNAGIEVPIFYKNDVGFIESGEEGTDYNDTFFYVGTEEIDGVVYDKWRKIEDGGSYEWDDNSKIFVLTNQVVRKLQSEVSTITHKGKPLESWEIKYCFDNDNERYGWVPNEFMIFTDDTCWFKRDGEFEYNGTKYYKWVSPQMGDNEFLLSQTLELNVGDMLDHYFVEEDVFETEYSTIEKTTNAGKGVIYYMKDEWNNECPYDFKNIMFNGFFTFNFQDGNSNLDGTMQTFKNDEGLETHFMDNSIDTYQEHDYEDGTIKYAIPYGNIFMAYLSNASDFYIYRNKIGKNCSYNTFGNYCHDNILNDNCSYNKFGNDKNNITLGNNCRNNEFWEQCYYITLGANSNGNIIFSSGFLSTGTEFNYNNIETSAEYSTFGNGCHDNNFNSIVNSSFGNTVTENDFLGNVENSTFGNYVVDNAFYGDKTTESSFGNYIYSNGFQKDITISSFGNYIYDNFFNNIKYSIFGNDIANNNFVNIESSIFGNDLVAVGFSSMNHCSVGNHIYRVQGDNIWATTIGNDCEDITIGGADSRKIYLQNSHIGNNISNIKIISNDRSRTLHNFKINSYIYGNSSSDRLIIDFEKIGSNIYFDGIQTQITLDQDQKGQILIYWNNDKLKKVGYYLESKTSTEWLPIPEENAGVNAEDVMNIIEENAEPTDTLDIGTSETFDGTSDNQVPTSKAVSDFVASAGGGSKLYRHYLNGYVIDNGVSIYFRGTIINSNSQAYDTSTIKEYVKSNGTIILQGFSNYNNTNILYIVTTYSFNSPANKAQVNFTKYTFNYDETSGINYTTSGMSSYSLNGFTDTVTEL